MAAIKLIFFLSIIINKYNLINSSLANDVLNRLSLTSSAFSNFSWDFSSNYNEDFGEQNHSFPSIIKRSASTYDFQLPKVYSGVYWLQDISEIPLSPVSFAYDLVFFNHDYNGFVIWYVATLERRNEEDFLIIYRGQDNAFVEITSLVVRRGLKLQSYSQKASSYLIVIEDEQINCKYCRDGSSIFEFNQDEVLHKIQTIDILYPSDVIVWNDMNDIFLAVTQKTFLNEERSIIYKWLGRHFDIVQSINTYNTQKITPFKIDHIQFLAVANHNDESGDTEVYSEIFVYDIHDEKFISYQKILTHAAVDIKYFCFKQGYKHEHFLVVANSYETDMNGNINYDTISIIYKYVDDYFIPFQSLKLSNVKYFLPVVGPKSEFTLLAFCENDGIKSYQYDGWRFIQSEVLYNNPKYTSNIATVQSYLYNDGTIIVTVNHAAAVNILTPTFVYQNSMQRFSSDVQRWCETQVNHDLSDLEELREEINQQYRRRSQVGKDEHIVRHSRQVSDNIQTNNEEQELRKRVEELESLLTDTIVLEGDVNINNLKISNESHFNDFKTNKINNETVEQLLSDIYYFDENFVIDDNFYFDNVALDKSAMVQYLNNHSIEDIIKLSDPNNILIVDGNVTIDNLDVKGLVDGVAINNELILTSNGYQLLPGTIKCKDVIIDNFNGDKINDFPIHSIRPDRDIKAINVKNIDVGSINSFKFPALKDQVYNKMENQIWNSAVKFENLIVKDFHSEGLLSGTKIPEDLILTDGGTFKIEQDLTFYQPLEAKTLHVIKNLNQLQVENGKMQVLLKDSPNKQFISKHLTFDDLHLLGLIKLQGQIESLGTDLEKLNPVLTIDEDLTLRGDFRIDGVVNVEEILRCDELCDNKKLISLNNIKENGLLLSESEIDVPVHFAGGIRVDDVYADSINGIDVKSWYASTIDDLQFISELNISRNMHISGTTNILAINGHNIQSLFENSLRITGDQVITGEHHYADVKTKSIHGNQTNYYNIHYNNEIRAENEKYVKKSIIIEGNAEIKHFETPNLFVKGRINDYNLADLIADTVFTDTQEEIFSHKNFETNLKFENLQIQSLNDIDVNTIKEQMDRWTNVVVFDEDMHLYGKINVENLHFVELNKIVSSNDFGNVWLMKDGKQTILGENRLENVYFDDTVTVRSGLINDLDLEQLFEDIRRIDTEEVFDFANFANKLESYSPLRIDTINNIPVSDFLLSNSKLEQNIHGYYKLMNNLTVNGYLYVNGLASGVNITELCHFAYPHVNEEPKRLLVNGNITFNNINNLNYLNDYNLVDIRDNAWHVGDEIKLDGLTQLDNVFIEGELFVEGFVDNVNLQWLESSYLSKSRNQSIVSRIHFENAIFEKDLISPAASVSGLLGNINLDSFLKRTLRHDHQTITEKIELDEVEIISDLNVECPINNLYLNTNVMRRDVLKNIFTGHQTITNLSTKNLITPQGTHIQGINVNKWLQNAILLNQPNTIPSLKKFKSLEIQSNVHLDGLFNSYLIGEENVMTLSDPQVITGKKTFASGSADNGLHIKNLKLNGLLNGIDIIKFIESQMKITDPSIQIKNNKIFTEIITANNAVFENTYQSKNIPKMVNDILQLNTLYNYIDEYRTLLDNSNKLLKDSKLQAWYLNYYKPIQTLNTKICNIISIYNYDNQYQLLVHVKESNTLNFYNWNSTYSQFDLSFTIDIFPENFELVQTKFIEFENKPFVYLEKINKENGNVTGSLYQVKMDSILENKYDIAIQKIESLISFVLPNKENCIVNVYTTAAAILCKNENGDFHLFQELSVQNGKQITNLIIENIPYLFIVNEGTPNMESRVDIWKLEMESYKFILHQRIFVTGPNGIDTVYYRGGYYLVISSSFINNSKYFGRVIMNKFDKSTGTFIEQQDLLQQAPLTVKFAELPTKELVLYVLTHIPTEPLTVYSYEGIAGFSKKISSSTLPSNMKSFEEFTNNDNEHFIIVYNDLEAYIIQAVFKGKRN